MAKQTKTFKLGRMNKSIDERLLPDGEYVDAMNIRVGSTELTEIGAVENTKGNSKLTSLQYNGGALSSQAVCIGSFADSEQETLYWFVHDPACTQAINGKVDMIVSYDTQAQQLSYHVVTELLLNFNPSYLVNGVDKIDDLLFFTDNYNEPRKINVTSDYSFPDVTQPAASVDTIEEIDISVIKPPPLESPTVVLSQISGGENYIEDTFICFAYRYQYADGEYSALSQFTSPAFAPSVPWKLESSSFLNDSMQNVWNQAEVTFKTGDSRVKGVDLIFKEADSNNLFVIDEYDVSDLNNNSDFAVTFTNGEIYTVLRSDEILRLYDNVPLKSKAQNIFGNRLMYGNYVEQRDLVDVNGNECDISYTVSHDYNTFKSDTNLPNSSVSYTFNPDSTLAAPPAISNGAVDYDLSGLTSDELVEGAVFQFTLECQGYGFSYLGDGPNDTGSSANLAYIPSARFQVTFSFRLDQDYNSVQDIFTSANTYFADVWGYNGNNAGDPSLWPEGTTFIDIFNNEVPTVNTSGLTFLSSNPVQPCMATRAQEDPIQNGTTVPNDTRSEGDLGGIRFNFIPAGQYGPNTLRISLPAHRYRFDTASGCSGNQAAVFQYFKINSAFGSLLKDGSNASLHSNRDYQVGIVYQDSNARQTTVLVSKENSAHVEAQHSVDLNYLRVNIPSNMRPPAWATRYKFMLKPSYGLYDVIYANRAYTDDNTGMVWVKLEGEQNNKVTEGLRLIVKSDSNGPLNSVVDATVLEVASQPENFLAPAGSPFAQPAGAYMRVKPVGWSADLSNVNTFDTGQLSVSEARRGGTYLYPRLIVPLYEQTPTGIQPVRVNQGDVVTMRFHFNRNYQHKDGAPCGGQSCLYENTITATQNYTDFKEFWEGEGVDVGQSDCTAENQDDGGPNTNTYYAVYDAFSSLTGEQGNNKYQFGYDPTQGQNYMELGLRSGTRACENRHSAIYARISIQAATGTFIFETVPQKVADGIYYEGADNYAITSGNHMSGSAAGDVNQVAGTSAGIVNLSFFNCFTFGNGAESFRIRDSITGNYFTLGNRSAGVTTQDYEQIRREASITYSGLYQEQTALNNLNNFNLGLANYKDCEESYGPIEVLHSFRDNLLVLQEDKISYITIDKNIITAADGSNIVTAAPTVLGQQIARVEEYGISNNPESFATYGRDMYFTDAKRGAVIKLSGVVSAGDSLQVVSDVGMRSWFRDLFITAFNKQKLGGYDPYMDEYVLASTTTDLPINIPRTSCRSRTIGAYLPPIEWNGLAAPTQYIIDAGAGVGQMNIAFTATHTVKVTATYNGVSTTVTNSGSFTVVVSKNLSTVTDVLIQVEPIVVDLSSVTTMDAPCPTGSEIKVVMVCLTDDVDSGETMVNQYQYEDTPYISPLTSESVTFLSGSTSAPVVSQFFESNGIQGTPSFPTADSTVTLIANGAAGGTFTFQPNLHQMAYVAAPSGTTYPNTPTGIANMLAASTALATNTNQAPVYTAQVDLSAAPAWSNLYLIYDYRGAGQAVFCHTTSTDPAESYDVCCECTANIGCTPFIGSGVTTTSTLACAAATSTTYYHDGSGVAPEIGDSIYSMSDCATAPLLNAGTSNYILLGDGTNNYIQLNSLGQIIAKTSC